VLDIGYYRRKKPVVWFMIVIGSGFSFTNIVIIILCLEPNPLGIGSVLSNRLDPDPDSAKY
jgi:hypothetical protein